VILGRAQCALGSPCDDRMHGDLVAIAEAAQRAISPTSIWAMRDTAGSDIRRQESPNALGWTAGR
jgi:hypothetical protein